MCVCVCVYVYTYIYMKLKWKKHPERHIINAIHGTLP